MCMSTAQARTKSSLVCDISPANFRIRWFLRRVHVHLDCADSRKVRVAVSGSVWARHFSCKFSRKMALVTCSCACQLRMSMSISTAQARTKWRSVSRDPSGRGMFRVNSPKRSLLWYSRWTNYSNPYPWVIGHPLPPPNFNVMVS